MKEVGEFTPSMQNSNSEELNAIMMKKMEIIDRKRKLMK
jgi:hypothetical protein